MAGVAIEDNGAGRSFSGVSTGQQQQRCQSGEALAEWRSSEQVENGSPSTSPPYWDSDNDDDGGPKPSELYGKYTWKIDKFSQINKRELRSDAFEVGGYKWYILIYPQGCDVCNHLSLFLCVANHDKLLPGWSHFAQFTIAVVNKDPKKSKYSDTLHRFWKKEHDWGWKKFMELSKVLDGFIDADTLIIKAQVQVIRERADRPFRCLDCQYKRELVRVYLTNVEQICRRFVEEHRAKLGKLLEDKARWSSFCTFWLGMDLSSRRRMSREKTDSILKVVVKHFFIEKEVTSTLVMDSLYSGLKSLESQNVSKKSKGKYIEAEELPVPIVVMEKDTFVLVDDVLLLLERAAIEPLPPKDEKGPQNRTKDGTVGEEFNKDSIERDERRLTELGRRTIEIFVLAHIFSKIEVSYQEAVALKKQEELIREEEAAWLAEIELKARRGALDKEKKSKKKQGKQKKNSRKGKDKGRDDKTSSSVQDRIEQDSPAENKEIAADLEIVLEKSEAVEDVSDVSDSADGVPEIPLVSEDTAGPVSWDTDTSEIHSAIEASGSGVIGLSGVRNGTEGRVPSPLDDTSSTCSSDSVLSIRSMQHKGKSMYHKNQKSPTRWKNHQVKLTSRISDWVSEEPSQPLDTGHPKDASRSSNRAEFRPDAAQSLQDNVVNGTKGKKDDAGSSSRNVSAKGSVDVELCLNIAACVASPPRSPSNSIAPPKSELRSNARSGVVLVKKASSDSPKQGDTLVLRTTSSDNTTPSKPVPLKISTLKPAEKPSGNQKHVASEKLPSEELIEPGQHKFVSSKPADKPLTDNPSTPPIPAVSRPLSAPLVPGPRPAVSVVSMVQTAPALARSVSAAGRLGPETTAYTSQCYVPQSYRNAMMGGPVAAASSSAYQNHSASSVMNSSHAYSQAATLVSAPLFSPHSSDRMDPSPIKPSISFGMVNHHDRLQNGSLWIEHTHRNGIRNPHGDHNSLVNEMQHLDLNGLPQGRSQDHVPPDFPACTSGRPNHVLLDDFPHLDIINDLLDDEHGVGMIARANSEYHRLGSGHHMNRQHTFPGDQSGPGLAVSSSSFDRMRNYHDNGFQHGYGASGRSYDALLRDMVPGASSRPYGNNQVDGFMPNQWQMGGSDSALLSVRNMDNDGYPYIPEYPNVGVGINGYTVFRPSNGL